jgi:adenylylsulfate kinase
MFRSLVMSPRIRYTMSRVFATSANSTNVNSTQKFDYTVKNDGKSTNIVWSEGLISTAERTKLTGRVGATIWVTGLSGSGKSTIACLLEQRLLQEGHTAFRLDGDNIRFGLNKDLGFTEADREENIRRIAEVAKLFTDSGTIAITAFISPYKASRNKARELHTKANLKFLEVFAECPLEVAESRDPKGLYKKARAGQLKNFTGIHDPYEVPENPELVVPTHKHDVPGCVELIMQKLKAEKII